MLRNVNPYWKARLFWIILLLAAFLIWLTSCSETKKLQKAENRVLADIESVKRIRAKTSAIFPCSTDTITSWVHDSTTVTNIKYITKTDTVTQDGIRYVFRLDTAFFEKTRWQTQTKIVVDREKENRLTDTINSLRLREATATGTKLQLEKAVSTENKRGDKWKLLFYIAVACLGVSAFFNVKGMLSKIKL